MSYILCKTKASETPFHITNISTNIYSIEELCFYLYNNLYLIDESLLNAKLSKWLKESLGLDNLSRKMDALLEKKASVGEMILPIFKEISYLTHEEQRMFNAKLAQYAAQPPRVRTKMKGDYLVEHEKYRNALQVYKDCLSLPALDETGTQFTGSVYYNMGCAHARLFEMSEAKECFSEANKLLHSRTVITGLMTAVCLSDGEEAMQTMADEMGIDEVTLGQIKDQIREARESYEKAESAGRYRALSEELKKGNSEEYAKGMKAYLKELTDAYHKNTGY